MSRDGQLPPKIQELLKKKGWTWPPDEKLRKQTLEAVESFSGSMHTPREILEEIHKEDFPGRFPEKK
jgi:hypothetical protein